MNTRGDTMFDINIKFNNICIKSVEEKDIVNIKKWFISQHMDLKYNIDFADLYERFLEYYMSECEFFLKINQGKNLLGILKGRIEFKATNMVWISCFCVDESSIDDFTEREILENVLNYFSENYGIYNFLTGISSGEERMMSLLQHFDFKLVRVNKKFYCTYAKEEDLLIMQKIN